MDSLLDALTLEGAFTHRPRETRELKALRRQAGVLFDAIERELPTASAGRRAILLDRYDLLYRIVRQAETPEALLEPWRRSIVDLWAKGDRSVSQGTLALMFARRIRRGDRGVDPKYVSLYSTLLSRWCRELTFADTFASLPDDENYRRLSLLLADDLSAYMRDQSAAKRRWIAANRLSDARQTTLSPAARKEYRRFAQLANTTN